MPVELNDATGSPEHAGSIAACGERLLELLGRGDDELDVSLVDDARIRELNRDYRSRDRATDVLSFPQLDEADSRPAAPSDAGPTLLGDVVISLDAAARQAAAGGWTVDEELARLLLHGVLHLLGYEHEQGGAREVEMKAEEARLAAALVAAGLPCAREEPA